MRRARPLLAIPLVLGALALPAAAAADDIVEPPSPVADTFCATDVAAGDVNADGRADVVIGCPNLSPGAVNHAGGAYVFLSKAGGGFEAPVPLVAPAPAASDFCGRSVAAGDTDGDGRADVVLGCDGDNSGAGTVVYFHSSGNGSFAPGTVQAASDPEADEQCGGSVAIGDFVGDARADVAAGCELRGALSVGRVATFQSFGTTFGAGSLARSAPQSFDRCGADVAVADVTGSAKGDVIMACSGTNVAGAVVFPGDGGGTITAKPLAVPGSSACGTSVAAGDVSGDGRADLAIGCSQAVAPNSQPSGAVAVMIGNGTGLDAPQWLYPPAPGNLDYCGTNVAIGPLLGDPRGDVLVGCSQADLPSLTDAGTAVAFRRLSGNDGFAAGVVIAHPAAAATGACGYGVAIGNVAGDGAGDAVVGCYKRAVSAVSQAGSAFVHHGSADPVANPDPPAVTPPPPPPPPPAPTPRPAPPSNGTDPLAHLPHIPSIRVGQDDSFALPELVCTGGGACFVLVDAKTSTPKRASASAAAAKAKKTKRSTSFAVFATRRFKLAAGEHRKLRLKLNSRAAKLLHSRKKLVVTFTIKISRPGSATRTIRQTTTLRAAVTKKAKQPKKAKKKRRGR